MATIVQKKIKKGIQFQVRYRLYGKQKTETFTSKGFSKTAIEKTEREANKFAKEIEANKVLGLVKNDSNMTFEQLSTHVFNLRNNKLEKTTIEWYKTYIQQLNNEIGNTKIRNDNLPMYIEAKLSELSKKKSARIIKIYMSILNISFKYAFKKNLISYNPMEKIEFELPKKQKEKVMPVDDEYYRALLVYSKDNLKYYYLFAFLYYTGLRVGEAQAITWNDLDYNKKIFTVDKALKRTDEVGETKTKIVKIGILHIALIELLEEIKMWQQECKNKFGGAYQDNNLIICNEDGSFMKYSAIRSYLRRADKYIGKKIRPHQLRHTFISKLIIQENMNPKVVQKLAGHSQIRTTMDTYADFFNGQFEENIYDDLNQAFLENKTLPKI